MTNECEHEFVAGVLYHMDNSDNKHYDNVAEMCRKCFAKRYFPHNREETNRRVGFELIKETDDPYARRIVFVDTEKLGVNPEDWPPEEVGESILPVL